jgi:L,D-transpeptidase catalytic domain
MSSRWILNLCRKPRRKLQSNCAIVLTLTTLVGCSKDPGDSDPAVDPAGAANTANEALEASQDRKVSSSVAGAILDVPLVNLTGESAQLAHAVVTKGPRIYSTELLTWIYEAPSNSSKRLGYLRAGSSVPTASSPVGTAGCAGGWYPATPRGFICAGATATLDAEHPIVQLFEQHPPRADQRLPYRYGTVKRPGAVYGRLPKRSELPENEKLFEEKFLEWLSAEGEKGASFRPEIWSWGTPSVDAKLAWSEGLTSGIPPFLAEGKNLPSVLGRPRPDTLVIDRMTSRVGHSFLDTFYSEGRRYGLTTQLELVPLDRYRPIAGSEFHGVEIGKDIEFPFAYVRRVGSKFSDGTPANYRDVLKLSGKKKQLGGRLHYETADGKLISDQYASELTLAKKMPAWATNGEKWISISITKQTLVLYEGVKPVYATLVSTGEAGLEDHETSTATKRGIFRIHTKHVSSTMSSDEVGEEFELRDVPYVQYFAEGGFALHGAYWHDRFGTPKSHGCINLAPEDARRIFYWTDPPVPTGWHGALLPLTGTRVFVHP